MRHHWIGKLHACVDMRLCFYIATLTYTCISLSLCICLLHVLLARAVFSSTPQFALPTSAALFQYRRSATVDCTHTFSKKSLWYFALTLVPPVSCGKWIAKRWGWRSKLIRTLQTVQHIPASFPENLPLLERQIQSSQVSTCSVYTFWKYAFIYIQCIYIHTYMCPSQHRVCSLTALHPQERTESWEKTRMLKNYRVDR